MDAWLQGRDIEESLQAHREEGAGTAMLGPGGATG